MISASRQRQPVSRSLERRARSTAARSLSRTLGLVPRIGEEGTPRPRVDDAGLSARHAEAAARRVGIAAEDYDRAGAHVLLLADDARHALVLEVGERLPRMLEKRAGCDPPRTGSSPRSPRRRSPRGRSRCGAPGA